MPGEFRRRTLLVTRRAVLLEWLPASWLMSATTACDDDAGTESADAALAGDAGDDSGDARFDHGVASGDPLADRVVLWTRVSGATAARVAVAWEVATDDGFADIVASGDTQAEGEQDYTVKVDAGGLEAGRAYHYRFRAGSAVSDVGRTRTLRTDAVDRLRLAVVSCASYMSGYFSSYADIAKLDVDAVLHLGDYIYEYGTETSRYYARALGRASEPAHEALTLDDYRMRYAQYRRDPDLAALHAAHPMIALWDDHEVADDVWNAGAANHSADEGDFATRRADALRAYAEWMPVRETRRDGKLSLFRHVAFGDLVNLLVVDTRLEDRDSANATTPAPDGGSNLGPAQERWLHDALRASKARGTRWRLLASQVMVAQLDVPDFYLDLQAWDGFPAVRERLLDVIEGDAIADTVVVSGDAHLAGAAEVARDPFGAGYDAETGAGALMPELVTPSLTAPAGARFLAADGPAVVAATHPHVKYLDTAVHGYLLIDVDRERVRAEWHASTTLLEPNAPHSVVKRFRVDAGSPRLVEE